jgi:hypothetical protein
LHQTEREGSKENVVGAFIIFAWHQMMLKRGDWDRTWSALLLHIRDAPSSNFGPEIGYPIWVFFYSFCQHIQANSGIVPPLGHHCLLPNPSQFIIFTLSCLPTLYGLDTEIVVK